jgi:two-component system phosphate regulon sensor histidine kinase PhoR
MPGLRGRMVATAMLAVAAALVVVLLVGGPTLRRRAADHTREQLLAEARLMAHVVEPALRAGAGPAELDPLVDVAAREVRARVTILAPDGRVLADSAASGPGLLALENHLDRPEVQEALSSGRGVSQRRSATVREDMLYAAVPVRAGDRLVGVARVALPLVGVEEDARAFQRALVLALIAAFLLTSVLSAAFASSLAGPLGQIMDAARQFAAGDLGARSRVDRSDELGELARILNRSADQLQDRITEIARDRARTEAMLAAMEDGVLAVDHRGTVLLANQVLRRELAPADEPLGRHYLEVIRQREVAQLIESVLQTGRIQRTEVEMRHRAHLYALTGAPFPAPEGERPGAVLTFHDVTERRRLDLVRRDFVANASHELRTPLTSIRGFVEALEDGAVDEPTTAARFLEKIRRHADRMAALVDDLLELSQLESGARPPRWQDVHPADVAADVAGSFVDLAARKKLRLDCVRDGDPTVVSDPDRLRRILENLVDNAVKYTPEGGRIEISTVVSPDGGATVVVADDGPGIPREHLPRLFERFYRADRARSRELGGTGLGLAIVRHLAEGMGASVSVASEPGQGARFTLRIPRTPVRTLEGITAAR